MFLPMSDCCFGVYLFILYYYLLTNGSDWKMNCPLGLIKYSECESESESVNTLTSCCDRVKTHWPVGLLERRYVQLTVGYTIMLRYAVYTIQSLQIVMPHSIILQKLDLLSLSTLSESCASVAWSVLSLTWYYIGCIMYRVVQCLPVNMLVFTSSHANHRAACC